MKCKNCGHALILFRERNQWIHSEEALIKNPINLIPNPDVICGIITRKGFRFEICGCRNPAPESMKKEKK